MSLLVVMGSGETAPTMVKIHREVLAQSLCSPGRGPAVMLDTPFGFQMNADDLVQRTQQYFADSVGTRVEVVRWRRADAPASEHETSLALLAQAAWAFAGPGSPTYALRQWHGTAVPDALFDVAHRGGTLVFGSAAACTLGAWAIPVYEIYKVGEEPRWEPGLDLLARMTGIEAVVVPHYDNAEGGQHDTRFCYLGEQRLVQLEAELPAAVGVLGVDEHTALLVNLTARTAQVRGKGTVTLRYRDRSQVLASGTVLTLDELAAGIQGRSCTGSSGRGGVTADPADPADPTDPAGPSGPPGPADPADPPDPANPPGPSGPDDPPGLGPEQAPVGGGSSGRNGGEPRTLSQESAAARARFDTALTERDVDAAVDAILGLEAAIVAWSADTMQSDETDRARRVLRSLVVRLGALAHDGVRDPRAVVGPLVEVLLELRARARAGKDFATSDLVRDRLAAAGVEVRDTSDGAVWSLVG
jgi:hypothetical protein